jgi:hypothetical protein
VTTNGEQAIVEAIRSLERAIVGSPKEGNPGLLDRVRRLERNQWLLLVALFTGAGTGELLGRFLW